MFSLTTLVENKYVKGKVETMSQVSELLVVQENLSKEIEEMKMRVVMSNKDVEILKLKLKNQQISCEGLSSSEALSTENVDLKKKVLTLTDEVKSLNAEVENLTKKMLDSHAADSARVEMLLRILSPKPPSI